MKDNKTFLHIYHVSAPKTTSSLFTQKNMDVALLIVSLAGLISAFLFLLTMPQ